MPSARPEKHPRAHRSVACESRGDLQEKSQSLAVLLTQGIAFRHNLPYRDAFCAEVPYWWMHLTTDDFEQKEGGKFCTTNGRRWHRSFPMYTHRR